MSWDYLGNEWAVEHLRAHAAGGSPRQAYLLTGESGIGRRTLALRFAQALNCTNPPEKGGFCGACRACRLISKLEHPDLDVVQTEQNRRDLRIDQIRELQRHLSLMPYEAAYRIALLLRFEEANLNAANALLKTLEEPPPRVILILTAHSPEALLPTIVSRCEVLRLRPMAVDELSAQLVRGYGCDEEAAKKIAHLSAGRAGAAIQYLHSPALISEVNEAVSSHIEFLHASAIERFARVDKLSREKDKGRLKLYLESWLVFWRDVLMHTSGAKVAPVFLEWNREVAAVAEWADSTLAQQSLDAIRRTLALLDANVNLRLALEILSLDLPQSPK